MEIEIYTKCGQELINEIYKSIEDEDIKTWEVRKDNNKYLTHNSKSWFKT